MGRCSMPDEGFAGAVQQHFTALIENLKSLLAVGSPSSKYPKYELEVLLLACCYVDALAGIFLDTNGSEARFRELLWDYVDQEKLDFRRIHLDILRKKLQAYPYVTVHDAKIEPRVTPLAWKAERLIGYLDQEIGRRKYNEGDIKQVNDSTVDQILREFSNLMTEAERSGHWGKVQEMVRESTYAGVLYEQYRSALVHEARVKGHWSWSITDLPVYIAVEGGDVDLTFPAPFLVSTLEGILKTVFSRYWVPVE